MIKIKLTTAICLDDQPVSRGTVVDFPKEQADSFVAASLAEYVDPADAPPSPTPTSDTPSESEAVSSSEASAGLAGGSDTKSTEPPAKPSETKSRKRRN